MTYFISRLTPTCPARAGLIPPRLVRHALRRDLSRTRGVDPAAGSHTLGSRDYLRVCGAVMGVMVLTTLALGSSPRVRSGPRSIACSPPILGIISACAERSPPATARTRCPRDHLRVCGAVERILLVAVVHDGSSPRVRSGQILVGVRAKCEGIISACAERSSWRRHAF